MIDEDQKITERKPSIVEWKPETTQRPAHHDRLENLMGNMSSQRPAHHDRLENLMGNMSLEGGRSRRWSEGGRRPEEEGRMLAEAGWNDNRREAMEDEDARGGGCFSCIILKPTVLLSLWFVYSLAVLSGVPSACPPPELHPTPFLHPTGSLESLCAGAGSAVEMLVSSLLRASWRLAQGILYLLFLIWVLLRLVVAQESGASSNPPSITPIPKFIQHPVPSTSSPHHIQYPVPGTSSSTHHIQYPVPGTSSSPHHIQYPAPGTSSPTKPSPQFIQLRLRAQDESETIIQMKRRTAMEKLRKRYGAKIGVPPATLRFLFDGQRIGNADTPDLLQMVHGDVIEVYFEQIGGRQARNLMEVIAKLATFLILASSRGF